MITTTLAHTSDEDGEKSYVVNEVSKSKKKAKRN
jgi:hypothetical protein